MVNMSLISPLATMKRKNETMEELKNKIFRIVVDRIEGEFAVCEFPDLSTKDILLSNIPFEVKSLDVILVKYNEKNELEFISLKPKSKTFLPPAKFIRFT